jgi:purine-binding chemotaxis protein CheW
VSQSSFQSVLVVKIGTFRCALPVSCVVETMRPLPVHPIPTAARFVAGASVIRGEAVPVVNLAGLLGAASSPPARFVVVRAGERKIAVAVDAVVGIHEVAVAAMASVPPLLAEAGSETVSALGAVDMELLLVLETARLVPDETWSALADTATR